MTGAPGKSLSRFAWLSIVAAVLSIALKWAAYRLTGSVGLLSDAIESVVNLVAAGLALGMLGLASRPPDEEHAFGHSKAEYFASAVEGALILAAASAIAFAAVQRVLEPGRLERLGLGLAVSTAASLLNLAVARVLFRVARRHRSIALEADAHHLMADVWTSLAVLLGVGLVAATGWERLDPVVALVAAANIVRTGVSLVRRSLHGLLDAALPEADLRALEEVLARHRGPEVQFHAVRTRQAAARSFVSMHVLVPGDWSVRRGHELVEEIEREVCVAIPGANVMTHLEALEDPTSWLDAGLDRPASSG
ncbi:MAG TPA: cation diffusion facilitator family transporter [Anaeromyxobacteraceae bacterium]|nr:cation diffusion facilitator family transporter [Anaeromyxobacteraceae bacterium]